MFNFVDPTLRNGQGGLKIVITVYQPEPLAVSDEAVQLLRIAFAFGNVHPKDVQRHSDLLNLKLRQMADDGIAPITTNNQIGAHFQVPDWRFCAYARDPIAVVHKLDNLGLHPQFEGRELLCLRRQKIKKMPLRHEPLNLHRVGRREKSAMHTIRLLKAYFIRDTS